MNGLDFKSFFNFMERNKMYAFINLFGLSVSLSFVILITTFTYKQLSTDSFQENADRIYLVGDNTTSGTAYYMQKYLLERYPEIEKTTAILSHYSLATSGDNTLGANIVFADSTFFDIFSFRLLEGDPKGALAVKNGVVVSKTFVNKMFGGKDPIGQTIILSHKPEYKLVVTGVMEDIKHSAIPYADMLVAGQSMPEYVYGQNERMESCGTCGTFVMVHPGTDFKAKIPDLQKYLEEIYWIFSTDNQRRVEVTPLNRVYFFAVKSSQYHPFNSGNWSLVMIMFAIALVLLVFSVVNYVNLTMAQTSFRAREMATRRLLGTQRDTIITKLISESTLICLVAYIMALCIAEALSSPASKLLSYQFTVFEDFNLIEVAFSAVLVLALGLSAGIIPALSISRFKPIDVMRGTMRTNDKMVWSKVLIVVQNVVTVAFLACALTMVLQVRHLVTQPLGYNTKDIFVVDNQNNFKTMEQINAFRDELLRKPAIENVGFGDAYPLEGTMNRTNQFEDGMLSIQLVRGDSAYFRIFGFNKIVDYNLSIDESLDYAKYYVTEAMANRVHATESHPEFTVGNEYWSQKIYIAGLYADFHVGYTFQDSANTCLELCPGYPSKSVLGDRPLTSIIKTTSDHDEAVRQIIEAYNTAVPNSEFNYVGYIDDRIKNQFVDQYRLLVMVSIFTLVAMLISALGLFAIAAYHMRQQRGDIAVRKVFGSTIAEELRRTVSGFMKWVLVGGVIACPIIYVIASRWLMTFNYRITLSWWIYGAAILFSLIVAFITILGQSIKAASTDPSECLRG